MISYEVALEKAKKLKENIDNVMEYENGWVFGFYDDSNYIGGYGHTPVVILKNDGKATNMPQFVADGTGEHIRSFDIDY